MRISDCPFCGSDNIVPTIREMDDRRYYTYTLTCDNCDGSISFNLGYRGFDELGSSGAIEYMKKETVKKWNQRSGYKIVLEVTP